MFKQSEFVASARFMAVGLTAASMLMGCTGAVDDPTSGGPPQPPPISEAARAQAEAITSNYHNLTVEKDERGAVVDFDSPAGHQHFSFAFGDNLEGISEAPDATATLPDGTVPYTSEWHWWGVKYRLNRGETRDLVTDGSNAAVLYAIGAAFGCGGACAVGAAIEASWSNAANRYYNEGNCIHINMPYMTTGRTNRNTYNCR